MIDNSSRKALKWNGLHQYPWRSSQYQRYCSARILSNQESVVIPGLSLGVYGEVANQFGLDERLCVGCVPLPRSKLLLTALGAALVEISEDTG